MRTFVNSLFVLFTQHLLRAALCEWKTRFRD